MVRNIIITGCASLKKGCSVGVTCACCEFNAVCVDRVFQSCNFPRRNRFEFDNAYDFIDWIYFVYQSLGMEGLEKFMDVAVVFMES